MSSVVYAGEPKRHYKFWNFIKKKYLIFNLTKSSQLVDILLFLWIVVKKSPTCFFYILYLLHKISYT